MKLNDMKRKHTAIQREGKRMYTRLLEMYEECNELQSMIRGIEKDDYDPIPLIFGGEFYIDEDDDHHPGRARREAGADTAGSKADHRHPESLDPADGRCDRRGSVSANGRRGNAE